MTGEEFSQDLADQIKRAAGPYTAKEEFVARALCTNDAKRNHLVDIVWKVFIPDARRAIEAIAEFEAMS